MLGGRKTFVLPPLFAYSSRNRPRRVPSYPMPVTEQPVATYLSFGDFRCKARGVYFQNSPVTASHQTAVLCAHVTFCTRFPVVAFLYYAPIIPLFSRLSTPFLNFYANFFYKKTESKNGTDLTNIVERIGLVAPSRLRELTTVCSQINEFRQQN